MRLYRFHSLEEAIETVIEINRVLSASQYWIYCNPSRLVPNNEMRIYWEHILDLEEASKYIKKSMRIDKDLNGDN